MQKVDTIIKKINTCIHKMENLTTILSLINEGRDFEELILFYEVETGGKFVSIFLNFLFTKKNYFIYRIV